MSELFELIESVCDLLEQANATYAITGSVASAVYSEPYASWDVDLCLQVSPVVLDRFLNLLPPRYYRDDVAVRAAAAEHSMINLVDNKTGLKIDLSFLPPGGYLGGVLARRKKITYGENKAFWTVSPEDAILMKLLWRMETESQKQWDNALAVVRFQNVRLDWPYLHQWADQLGLRKDLELLKRDAGI
ncbi:MAG TPA: hypothetical protein VJZ71_21000 [Phycisphaerae bacterium]|nr:hypothetical protein [Phycisphaerae bacterium]